ncbi:hypothetical protein RJI07_07940 [Mycoplasmatota bacterium WC30]
MNYLWGSLMLLFGALIFIGALKKSNFILYKLLHARAKMLWGDNAHTFLLVLGVILMGLSSGFFFKLF